MALESVGSTLFRSLNQLSKSFNLLSDFWSGLLVHDHGPFFQPNTLCLRSLNQLSDLLNLSSGMRRMDLNVLCNAVPNIFKWLLVKILCNSEFGSKISKFSFFLTLLIKKDENFEILLLISKLRIFLSRGLLNAFVTALESSWSILLTPLNHLSKSLK